MADIGSRGSPSGSSLHRTSFRGESTRLTRGFQAIVDDILVYDCTKDEHDANLRGMLERTREKGIKLNKDKSAICVPEVSYFGHRLTREGIRPDPNKIKAIKDLAPPRNRVTDTFSRKPIESNDHTVRRYGLTNTQSVQQHCCHRILVSSR